MNTEFFEALQMLEKERGINEAYLVDKIKAAIVIAVKKNNNVDDANVSVVIDPETGKFSVSIVKEVVGEVENPKGQMTLDEAKRYKKSAAVGDMVEIPLDTKDFGRIAAQTAKHVIRQALREAERSQLFADMQSKAHEIVPAVVTKVDPVKGIVVVDMGRSEAVLPRNEQVPSEVLHEGERVSVYVVDVVTADKGPRIMISRTHPGLVKRMFELEVPEIYDGTVEIRAIAREAGMRTKMAVSSKDPNVDAVGACIGTRGARVAKIVEELGGEKIDIVKYSDNPEEFIASALSPATVLKVEILEGDAKSCRVTVPDSQLSLAIGNRGQNARLAVRLTGYKIDIRPESGGEGTETSPEDAAAEPAAADAGE